jgi:flagellar biosynthesis/type III secretory pathway M-ring protein FliF/YscJ
MENKEEKPIVKKEENKPSSIKESQFKKIEWNKKALITTLVLLGLLIIVFVIVMILVNNGFGSQANNCNNGEGGTCPIHFISLL